MSKLKEMLTRAESWPEADQAELVELAQEIEARHAGEYEANVEELAGIDSGLLAAAEGRFAAEDDAEATFSKYRWI
ncbi:hypothetical protein SAMN05444161_3652 [Rhizobiales bacterium GAS191]|nr:hypothetical protein SAMN05519103_02801 [Rhizobiales bacterium GAS113]SED64386.1 hypothetical protein SAMN05444161_3652 [Rhizobiales bacterium GAS191]SEE75528.1 hypothetical protein SAMN05519104_7359 [Rhizobiales bacterium GAS188]